MTKLYSATFVIAQNKREIRIDCSSVQDVRHYIIWELCKKEKGVLLGVIPNGIADKNRIKEFNTLYTFLNDGSILYEVKDNLSFYHFYWGYYLFYVVDIKEESIIKKIEKNYAYLRSRDIDNIACKGINDVMKEESFKGFNYLKSLLISSYDIDAIRIIPALKSVNDVKEQVIQIIRSNQFVKDVSSEEYPLK